jgi:hypothetical protein
MTDDQADRRQSPRRPTSGPVDVSFSDPLPVTVRAELMDSSESGVQITHESKLLVPGLAVSLTQQNETKQARVVWTQLKDGRRISGCLLLH